MEHHPQVIDSVGDDGGGVRVCVPLGRWNASRSNKNTNMLLPTAVLSGNAGFVVSNGFRKLSRTEKSSHLTHATRHTVAHTHVTPT